MTATPKQPSKDKIIKSLTEQNAKLIDDNTTLTTALEKEQSGEIKLPMTPSVGQVNRVIDWVIKIKAYYASVKDVPEKIKELAKEEAFEFVLKQQ